MPLTDPIGGERVKLPVKIQAAGQGAARVLAAKRGLWSGDFVRFHENENLGSGKAALKQGVVKAAHTRITQIC